MVQELDLSVVVRSCPTVRTSEGLALSSRSQLLTEEHKQSALILYRSLRFLQTNIGSDSPADVVRAIKEDLSSSAISELEYLELLDLDSLLPITKWNQSKNIAAFIAARIGGVRLIDNVVLKA